MWGKVGTEPLPPPVLGHSESAFLETHMSGMSNLGRKMRRRLGNPWGGEAGSSGSSSATPSSSPPSPGSGGKLFIKTPPVLSFICGE